MGNMLIVYRNYLDAAVLSGGAWSGGLPLENLAHPHPSRVARSLGAANGSCWFEADFGVQAPVSFAGILNHNLSQRGIWRVRLHNGDPENPALDTGAVPIWPRVVPFGTGHWGEFQWGGHLDTETAETYGIGSYAILPAARRVRYARIDLEDPDNPSGYLQAGRAMLAPAWTPSVNLQYGWSIEQVDESRIVKSRGGQAYFESKPKYRRLRFRIEHLDIDEMLANAYELERLKGAGGDILAMVDPDDTAHLHRRTVYGRIAETTPIVNDVYERYSKEFVIEELY
jgi:hypothetical protein